MNFFSSFISSPTSGSFWYLAKAAGFAIHSCIAAIILGFDCALAMISRTLGFFIISAALPITSPPPPKGLAPTVQYFKNGEKKMQSDQCEMSW